MVGLALPGGAPLVRTRTRREAGLRPALHENAGGSVKNVGQQQQTLATVWQVMASYAGPRFRSAELHDVRQRRAAPSQAYPTGRAPVERQKLALAHQRLHVIGFGATRARGPIERASGGESFQLDRPQTRAVEDVSMEHKLDYFFGLLLFRVEREGIRMGPAEEVSAYRGVPVCQRRVASARPL